MPTIRIDEDVYKWLQSLATPFEDNPNTVLRRIAGLGPRSGRSKPEVVADSSQSQPARRRSKAEDLIKRWSVAVAQGYYHKGGAFYMNLTEFPGALFDPNGYVVFETEDEYRNCHRVNVGDEKTNVSKPGIQALPQYKRMV